MVQPVNKKDQQNEQLQQPDPFDLQEGFKSKRFCQGLTLSYV
jgi:hypothetical protein